MSSASLPFSYTPDGLSVNITSVDYVLPVWVNSVSIGNSVLYLFAYSIFYISFFVMLYYITVRRKLELKKNAQILFILVGIFVGIGCLNLLFRTLVDIMYIDVRIRLEKGEALFDRGYFISWNFFASVTTFLMFSNYVVLYIIEFYVKMIFWKTAVLIRAISKKQFKYITTLSNIIFGFFVVLMFLVVLIAALLFFLLNMGYVSKSSSNIAYYLCFALAGGMFVFDCVFAIYSGVLVIRTISRNNRIQLERNPNFKKQEHYSNPFVVTFGLLIGLILCILCQLIAAGVASVVGSDKSILKVVWHFFSCLAVLIFAVISLLLFYPLFVRAERAIKEMNLETSSHDHKSARSTKKSERSEKVQPIETSENCAIKKYEGTNVDTPKTDGSDNEETPQQEVNQV